MQKQGKNATQPFRQKDLVFLKLGGSLITYKDQPQTPRLEAIQRLAGEIAAARAQNPDLRLLLGHGSGSFGHIPAHQHHTRWGVHNAHEWLGFVQVWYAASLLNRIVQDALTGSGLPAISLSPCAAVTALDGRVQSWDLYPIQSALMVGLIPVVFGDVIFDQQRGGTILSTEDLFAYLAPQLLPGRVLLAGIEMGVWEDFPANSRLATLITPATLPQVVPALSGSAATDVTGGMASKVEHGIELVKGVEGLEVEILSGAEPGVIQRALLGEHLGTLIRRDDQDRLVSAALK